MLSAKSFWTTTTRADECRARGTHKKKKDRNAIKNTLTKQTDKQLDRQTKN